MKPLVSGAEAKRYIEPQTEKYLLFPYTIHDGQVALVDRATLESVYPKAWGYLRSYEDVLRGREDGKMDIDDKWWRTSILKTWTSKKS